MNEHDDRTLTSYRGPKAPRGAIPIQAPHLLKGLIRQDSNVSRQAATMGLRRSTRISR